MKDDIKALICMYEKELKQLEINFLAAREACRTENESYFFGQWCRLGTVICDLKGRIIKDLHKAR